MTLPGSMESPAVRMLIACNQAILRSSDERCLMQEVCRIAVHIGGYRLAWVGVPRHDVDQTVHPVAAVGFEAGYLESAKISWGDNVRGQGPTGKAIRLRKAVVCNDFQRDPQLAPWRARALRRGYRSSIALPIKRGREVFGALSVYAARPNAFSREKARILRQLSDDLAIGIGSLRDRARIRELVLALTLAEQRERQRVAEVIHDELQQLLFGAKLALAPLTKGGKVAERETVAKVRDIINESLFCSKNLTYELSPPCLADRGLWAALEWLADDFKKRGLLDVRLRTDPAAAPASPAIRTLLYRCVREILFNVVKHAKSREVTIEAKRVAGRLRITIADEGVGFDPSAVAIKSSRGFGLHSIRDRMSLLGGSFKIESSRGRGSKFTLST